MLSYRNNMDTASGSNEPGETESWGENENQQNRQTKHGGNKVKQQAGFTNTISAYVTLIGYSAGMSDFWRFPFLVYRNGGGAFLMPFLLTTCICGIPLFFLEYTLANFSGKGPYRIWDISPLFRGIGVTVFTACTLYSIGATVFRGWLVYFFAHSFENPLPWTRCDNSWNTNSCLANPFVDDWKQNMTSLLYPANNFSYLNVTEVTLANKSGMTAAEEYWQYETLRLSSGMTDLVGMNWPIFLCIVAFRFIVFLGMVKSIKSIEKIMYLTTFIQFTFITVVFIRSLVLEGASDGLARFFKLDFEKLANPRIWIEAFLMAFYTMSFGWGTIITLGSHGRFKEDSIKTSILIPLVDSAVAIMTGTVCFSVLGNMAHAYGVHVDKVINAGMSLGVVSYITALSSLPLPQLWCAGFFISVILSGIDTQVVVKELCIQIIGELFPGLFPKDRFPVLVGFTVFLVLCALPTATGAGAYIFLWVDWYAGVWTGPICAFLEIVVVVWIYGIDRFNSDVRLMIGKPIPGVIRFTLAFLTPCLVMVIFLTSVLEYVPPRYGAYEYPDWARVLGWLVVTFIMSPIPIYAVRQLLQHSGTLVKVIFLTSVLEYVPPRYGAYEYPDWARVLARLVIRVLARLRVQLSSRCNSQWGPKEEQATYEYQIQQATFKKRTRKELLYFTIFGRYKNNKESVLNSELNSML